MTSFEVFFIACEIILNVDYIIPNLFTDKLQLQ